MELLTDNFSLKMLSQEHVPAHLVIEHVDCLPVGLRSRVYHPDNAKMLGVQCVKMNYTIEPQDTLYVAIAEPDGFSILKVRHYGSDAPKYA